VHAILESVPLVDPVILQLKRTSLMLDDLDESLKVCVGWGMVGVDDLDASLKVCMGWG
jgi:hypothetical protein